MKGKSGIVTSQFFTSENTMMYPTDTKINETSVYKSGITGSITTVTLTLRLRRTAFTRIPVIESSIVFVSSTTHP